VHVLEEGGATRVVMAVSPDADALRTLAAQAARWGEPVRAAIESMNGARFTQRRGLPRGPPRPYAPDSPFKPEGDRARAAHP